MSDMRAAQECIESNQQVISEIRSTVAIHIQRIPEAYLRTEFLQQLWHAKRYWGLR